MQKLLALVLSVSILVSSVTPAWSQVRGVARGVVRGAGRVPAIRGKGVVSPSVSSALNRRVYTQMAFANSTVQNRVTTGQTAGLANYMLTLPATKRGAALRQDFVALSLVPKAVSPSQRIQAGEAFAANITQAKQVFTRITQPDLATFLTEYRAHPQTAIFTDVQNVLADAAALALIGTREQAPALLNFYQQLF